MGVVTDENQRFKMMGQVDLLHLYHHLLLLYIHFILLKHYFLFTEKKPPVNPCDPSPCGPNSICQVRGESPACTCLENYIGQPPNCRPECTINPECTRSLACMNQKCRDPCPGSCGSNALCSVINHNPTCSCQTGYTGDPFQGCVPVPGRIF